MRNATILVVRLRGTATETIKNIVLAGIGKLVIVDSDDVSEEDLGTGFFFRQEDVGKKVGMAVLLWGIHSDRGNCLCYFWYDRKWTLPRLG